MPWKKIHICRWFITLFPLSFFHEYVRLLYTILYHIIPLVLILRSSPVSHFKNSYPVIRVNWGLNHHKSLELFMVLVISFPFCSQKNTSQLTIDGENQPNRHIHIYIPMILPWMSPLKFKNIYGGFHKWRYPIIAGWLKKWKIPI